jgi:sugar lactone lactonase YvrE
VGGEVKRTLALALSLLLGAPLRAALPTSDAFGYSASAIPFGWTDISGTGTPITASDWLPNADDGAVQVDLPFNFRFYGGTYAKVYLSTNGYIQFGSSSSFYAPNCLNLNVAPLDIAAAYWMDLDPSAGGTVHKEVLNLAPNRSMVLQFTGVPPRLGSGSVTFQIVINEDNSLEFFYFSTSTHDSGASASAGLRGAFDCPNRQALPISCAQPVLTDGSAILISYPAVEPGCGTATITPTFSISPSFSVSPTFSRTATRSFTPTVTPTISETPTVTESWSASPTLSDSPTVTESPSITPTHSASPSATESPSVTPTDSDTYTITPTDSVSPTASETPSITETATESPSSTASPTDSDTPTETPSFSASPSASETPTGTATPSFTASPTATPTATPTASPTATETPTASASPTQSPTRTASPTSSASPTATPTFTATATLFPPAAKPACIVLGQVNFSNTGLSPASAATFSSPGGVAMDTRLTPFRVYVADSANNRVLFWNDASLISPGSSADGVIGQSSFSGSAANRGGAVSASGLSNPQGLAVDPGSGALWVADTGNHRVLRFSLPLALTGSAAADRVLGQGGSFSGNSANQGGLSASSLNDPRGLGIDAFGSLVVADTGNHRVLRFGNPGSSSVANASWGQGGSFSSNTANLGGVGPQSLNSPGAALLLANELWVADTGNHRVLQFSLSLPLTQTAALQLGQPNFTANSPNRGFALANDDRFNSPRGLAVDLAGRLLVSDTNNNRVIGFEPPYPNQAVLVWGQTSLGFNFSGAGNDGMSSPIGIAANGASLLVADSGNQRAIGYGCGAGLLPSTATPTFSATATATPTFSASPSITVSPTRSPSFTISPTFSQSPTRTLSGTRTISPTLSPTPSVTATFSASPTVSRTPTATITMIPSAVPPLPTLFPHSANGVIVYPNPATRAGGRACFAYPPAAQVEIKLYDLLGEPVATLDPGSIQGTQGTACWDLKAADGSVVAPGLYYLRILADGQAWMAKLTVNQ